MTRVLIELDEHQTRDLQELANAERRSTEDLCREAIANFLRNRIDSTSTHGPADRYSAFRKMIGLVKAGPTDASGRHDRRPEDPE